MTTLPDLLKDYDMSPLDRRPKTVHVQLSNTRTLLEEMGVNYCVAGGYARDMYFGRTPRDADVWLIGAEQHQLDQLDEFAIYYCWERIGGNYCEDSGDRNIDAVYKAGKVDLIVCSTEVQSLRDVMQSFDYNINQFYMNLADWNSVYAGEFDTLGTLTLCKEDVRPARIARITDIARQEGWL